MTLRRRCEFKQFKGHRCLEAGGTHQTYGTDDENGIRKLFFLFSRAYSAAVPPGAPTPPPWSQPCVFALFMVQARYWVVGSGNALERLGMFKPRAICTTCSLLFTFSRAQRDPGCQNRTLHIVFSLFGKLLTQSVWSQLPAAGRYSTVASRGGNWIGRDPKRFYVKIELCI